MTLRFHPYVLKMSNKARLHNAFGDKLRHHEPLARYTSARIGGPAEHFITADSASELAQWVRAARQEGLPYTILGGGANVLVSDAGVRGLVILNRAKAISFAEGEPPVVRAESGANLGALARQCVARGLAGLEWAATVPGTLGGAVYGNAGAHGSDMAANLRLAEILQADGQVAQWTRADLALGYRTSALKRAKAGHVILSVELELGRGTPAELQKRVDDFVAHRKRTQPPGASLGSMFKNPPGDYAGRLIEAAGLKGHRIGQAQISPMHANFFLNTETCRAADVFALIHRAHTAVKEQFGVDLELEVELLGEWGATC